MWARPSRIVVADNRYLAEDAAALVEIDYETLPAAADCRKAAQPGAPPVRRELNSNVIASYRVAYGDAEAAFAQRARTCSHEDFWQHRGAAHSIEGRGILAEFRGADDSLTVWASTQKAHDLRQSLTALLDLDETGCAWRRPMSAAALAPSSASIRRMSRWSRPRSCSAARSNGSRTGASISPMRCRSATSTGRSTSRSMRDGKVLGIRGRLLHDQGAYALQDVNLPYNSASDADRPLYRAGLAMDVTVAATNKAPVSSVRGAGYPQAAFAMERLMDRRRARAQARPRRGARGATSSRPEKMPYTKPLKTRAGRRSSIRQRRLSGLPGRRARGRRLGRFPAPAGEARAQGRYIGIGLAHALKGTGRGPFESGMVRVSPSGRVSVFTGAAAMGQGLKTALAQICASELGVRGRRCHRGAGRHRGVSLGLGGFASRQTVTAGNSVLLAARAVADKAKKLASHVLEAAEHDLEIVDGAVRVIGAPPAFGLARRALAHAAVARPATVSRPASIRGSRPAATSAPTRWPMPMRCHVAEVEVDVETGDVRILRYFALQDSGMLVNPMIVDGQVHGGIAHGIGNALFEWMGYDDGGQPLTTTFRRLPAADRDRASDARRRLSADALAAQSAGRQGRGRGRHHPGRGGDHLRGRGRAHAVRRAHRPGPHHAVQAGGADRGRTAGARGFDFAYELAHPHCHCRACPGI